MTNDTQERLLFVVSVDQAELKQQPMLQTFITQIEHNNPALIEQIQKAIEGEAVLAGQVKLLALANYLNLFVGIIKLPSAIIKLTPEPRSHWDVGNPFVMALLHAVFAEHDRNLTWTLIRVNELHADQFDHFSLLGMKGIGSRG
jgi:hypothetical protein